MIPHTIGDSHVLAALDAAGAQLPAAIIPQIAAQPDRYAAPLRTRLATRINDTCDETQLYARSHALVFLAEWRDEATLSILAEVLSRHDDYLDGIYDVFEATIPHYGPAALPLLTTIVHNAAAPRAARIVCVTTLGIIAHHHPLVARTIARRLRDALPASSEPEHDEHEVWSWIVTTLAEMRAKSATAQIEALYKAGLLDPNICGRPAEYRRAVRAAAPIAAQPVSFAQPLSLYS